MHYSIGYDFKIPSGWVLQQYLNHLYILYYFKDYYILSSSL